MYHLLTCCSSQWYRPDKLGEDIDCCDAQSGHSFNKTEKDSISYSCGAQPASSQDKFQTYFADNISPDLDAEQRQQMFDCLYEHQNVFVTPENPNLGLTHEVEHII